MHCVRFANVSRADLIYLYGVHDTTIKEWIGAGLPENSDGSFTLSKAIRWREQWHAEQAKRKVLLSRLTQKELAALAGRSRQAILAWNEAGLVRNEDKSYDVRELLRWLPGHYKRSAEQRCRKIRGLLQEILKTLTSPKETKCLTEPKI
jgi:hypothetical protein